MVIQDTQHIVKYCYMVSESKLGITKIVLLGIVGSWWTSVLVVLLLATYFHILVDLYACLSSFGDLFSYSGRLFYSLSLFPMHFSATAFIHHQTFGDFFVQ